jgi:hypothetical protein
VEWGHGREDYWEWWGAAADASVDKEIFDDAGNGEVMIYETRSYIIAMNL